MAFFTLTYFHWEVDDKIIWGPDSNGIWQPENLRSYTADGVEAGATVRPLPAMLLSFFYTYTNAEEESREYTKQQYAFPPFVPADFQYNWVERRAQYTPEHQYRVNFRYWFDFGLTASATVRGVSNRVWYRTETAAAGYPFTKTTAYTLGSYWTADFKLEQRLSENLIFSFEGTNIFDEQYDTYFGTFTNQVSGVTSVAAYPGAGRSLFAAVTFEY
jgi:iron complex outermembrane receptor protein